MRGNGGQVGRHAEEDHVAIAQLRHLHDQRVARVEHRHAAVQHHVDLGAQHAVHLLDFLDVILAKVVGYIDIGHYADLATVVGEAFGQDCAAVVLDHGGIHRAIHQDAAGCVPVGAVAALHLAAVQVEAVAASQAGVLARELQQARDQLGHHGLAVGAGDADHGYAAVVVAFASREQVIHHGTAHRAGFTVGGLQVHQQAGAGIDLDNGAALLGERARNVLRHQVDAGDVQAHDAGGQRGMRGHARVHAVGHVEGHIAVALDQHMLALGRYGSGVKALALEFQARGRIQPYLVERVVFGAAAARVGIDLRFDQLVDG